MGIPGLSVSNQRKVRVSDEMYLRCLMIMLVSAEGRKRAYKPPTWSLAENPQDPEEYLDKGAALRQKAQETGGLPSWFATQEFRVAARLLGMSVYAGDQGPYGHPRKKPTGWASTRELPELLKGPGTGVSRVPAGDESSLGGDWESKSWAKWAVGMIDLLINMLDYQGHEELKRAEVNWAAHIAGGHWPPLRQCRTCISTSARHRAHRRISSPASWVLSLDTIGPFRCASDEVERNLRFALIGCLVVPVDDKGRPVLGPAQTQAADVDQMDSGLNSNDDDDQVDLAEALGISAIDDMGDDQGPDVAQDERDEVLQRCRQDQEGMTQAEAECMVPNLKWKEVHFIEVLKRKTPASIVLGTSRILADLRELGLPVSRIHTDAGTEYINSRFRDFVSKHDLKHTCASPQEPSSNGRVEASIGRIKNLAKVHLHGGEGSPELWPLALRAAVASMRSQALRSMSFPIPTVVPFGTKVHVLTRTWLRRQKKEWYLKAKEATVLCPAALVKRGYVVKVGKQLAVVTKLFHGEQPQLTVSVETKDEGGSGEPRVDIANPLEEPPLAHSIDPERRITGKSTIPAMHVRPPPESRYREKAPAPGRIPVASRMQEKRADEEEDAEAARLAKQVPFNINEAVQFLLNSSYVKGSGADSGQSARLLQGRHYIFGTFRHGGVVGLTNNCKLRPGVAKLLAGIAKAQAPRATFTTAVLSVNAQVPPHRDSTNLPSSTSHWIPLITPKSGGRLWTQVRQGDTVTGVPMTIQVNGQAVIGQFHETSRPVAFNPTVWHGVESWRTNQPRVVLLLYTTNCIYNITPQHWAYLQDLGFALPAQDKGGDPCEFLISSNSPKVGDGVDALEGDDGSFDGVRCVGSGEGLYGIPSGGSSSGLREGLVGSSGLYWCALCEERVAVGRADECVQCGCVLQQSPKESCSKNPKTQIKTGKSQNQIKTENSENPNKNCIISKLNSSVKEAELDLEGPVMSEQSREAAGSELGWIQGSGTFVSGQLGRTVSEGGDDHQVVLWDPDGEQNSFSNEVNEGLGEDQREPRILDEVVVDVATLEHGCERGCDLGLLECSHEVGGGVGTLEHGRERGCDLGLLECGHEVGCEVGTLEHGRERGCDVGMLELYDCHRGCDKAGQQVGHEPGQDGGSGLLKQGGLEACVECHEVEDLHGPLVEELRAIEVVGSRQKDIDDFAAWLDESQLRLATYHEEALQGWIEGTEVCDEQAVDTRDQLNKIWQHVEDIRHELSELCAMQLRDDLAQLEEMSPELSEDTQEVLQTRIVSNWEVSQHWDLWKPAAVAELDELVISKEALEGSTLADLRKLESRGYKVVQLPSKLVCSIKAPAGRRKIRLVACGNYMALIEKDKRSHREVVYASATSVEALRTCISWSVRRKHILLTADIRAAFLNAQLLPRARTEAERAAKQEGQKSSEDDSGPIPGEEIIVLVPPRLLVSKGLIDGNTRYIIRKALYGLDQAPRDWSLCRDTKLERALIPCEGVEYRLFRSFVEDNVWLIHHCEPRRGFEATLNADTQTGEISAWLIVYVDDILIGGPRNLAQATMRVIRELWQCSEAEEVGQEKPVRFLGLDLIWLSEGLLALGQESYLKDLVERYGQEIKEFDCPAIPLAPFFDEEAVEDSISADQLKRAQGILGELLWASIRTRPDITFAISKLASRTTKAPGHVYRAGLHVLAYLSGTMSHVLTYASFDRPVDPDSQRKTSLSGLVQGYGDASFAPEAKRSVQCLQVFAEGNLIAWSVSRQPFMTVSSCESEMVALLDLGTFTQSMAFLVDELIQRRSEKELRGDNVASITIYSGMGSHWRTRHLRIRARMFQERNRDGNLPAYHIPGEGNPADLGTKSLPAARQRRLSQLVGLQPRALKIGKIQGSGLSFKECLMAVILACCLRAADAHPGSEGSSGDKVLWAAIILIIISSIAVWEGLRGLVRVGDRWCRRRIGVSVQDAPEPEPDGEELDEPQPDQEDELVEEEYPRPPVAAPEPPLPQDDIGLRRRPMPVHGPEPDDEPLPQPPRNPPPPDHFQGIVLGRHVDDVVLGVPQRILNPNQPEVPLQGIAPPPEPRIRIRPYEEVREQVLREQQERQILGMPVHPPVVLNPNWGPALVQPSVGQVRQQGNDWGGPGSVAFHPPPAHFRGDFFQVDLIRGVLIRWHGKSRTRLFSPEAAALPEPLSQELLTGRRRSFVTEMTRWYHIEDNYRQGRATRAMPAQWRGRTELEINIGELNRTRAQQPHQVD